MPLVGDIALRAPHPHQIAVFDEADDVIKEDADSSFPIVLARFRVGHAITGAEEGADLFAVGGIGHVVQVGKARPHELTGFAVAVHARHGVVAFRDARARVQAIDLLLFRQRDRDGGIDFQPRHPF